MNYNKDELRYRDPEKRREYQRRWHENARKRLKDELFEYLGGKKCIRCGSTFPEVLEVNHKNMGGSKEKRERFTNPYRLYNDILKNKRKNEFNVLCKLCNIAHYLEKRYGLKYKITFLGKEKGE